jgi:hypothetical protein
MVGNHYPSPEEQNAVVGLACKAMEVQELHILSTINTQDP